MSCLIEVEHILFIEKNPQHFRKMKKKNGSSESGEFCLSDNSKTHPPHTHTLAQERIHFFFGSSHLPHSSTIWKRRMFVSFSKRMSFYQILQNEAQNSPEGRILSALLGENQVKKKKKGEKRNLPLIVVL